MGRTYLNNHGRKAKGYSKNTMRKAHGISLLKIMKMENDVVRLYDFSIRFLCILLFLFLFYSSTIEVELHKKEKKKKRSRKRLNGY